MLDKHSKRIEIMAIVSFPRVLEGLVNLRELWENDAITIINLLNYYIYVSWISISVQNREYFKIS